MFRESGLSLFFNLTQDEIASDDSIIQHHYQHQNVFDAAGLRQQAAQPLEWDDVDYTLQTDLAPFPLAGNELKTVMAECITLLLNKAQIFP